MNIAVIPAGGQGRRMTSGENGARAKQFLQLEGVPIIVHTLRQFIECPDIDAIQLAVPEGDLKSGTIEALIDEYQLTKMLPPVVGAAERQGSVFCGLQAIARSQYHESTRFVAIHDAVRPFITSAMISATINAAQQHEAALCALPATDTIKEVIDGKVMSTLPRVKIYHAQTPQTFRYELILDAHQRAYAEGFAATDDAMLIERLGQSVAVVEGSADNIKITKPTDLALAEMILARRREIAGI